MSRLKNTLSGIIVALGIFTAGLILAIGLAALFILGWNAIK